MSEIEKIREWLATCPKKLGPYDDTARADRLESQLAELENIAMRGFNSQDGTNAHIKAYKDFREYLKRNKSSVVFTP